MTIPTADEVRETVRNNVYDPEIGLNIVDLGLLYDVAVVEENGKGKANIKMTLTSPGCPVGPHIIQSIQTYVSKGHPELDEVNIRVVWEPMWNPDMMSDEARDQLGFF